jgi:Bacterial protein of unknown function (DUF899)
MEHHKVVSSDEWLAARIELLMKEKELTRLRDDAQSGGLVFCSSSTRVRMHLTCGLRGLTVPRRSGTFR